MQLGGDPDYGTQFMFLRAATDDPTYYWRMAATPTWQGVNLTALEGAPQRIFSFEPPAQPFAVDATAGADAAAGGDVGSR